MPSGSTLKNVALGVGMIASFSVLLAGGFKERIVSASEQAKSKPTELTTAAVAPPCLQEASISSVRILAPNSPMDASTAVWPAEGAMSEGHRRQVQEMLRRLGFDPGPGDGLWGTRTRRAIRNYQQATGTAPTGTLTAVEASRLASIHAAIGQAER